MTPVFFNRFEAAKILKVHPRTIFVIVQRLGWKIGPCGQWRFDSDDLRKMASGGRR